MFGLGIAAYGVAKILSGDAWRGLIPCGLGLWCAGMVRPHIAALVAVSLAVAVITRKSRTELRELTPILKGGTIVAVAIFAALLVVRTDRFLQRSGIDTSQGVSSTLTDVESRTAEGGSEFVPSILDSPLRAPSRSSPCCSAPSSSRPTTCSRSSPPSRGRRCSCSVCSGSRWMWAAMRSLRRQPYVVFSLTSASCSSSRTRAMRTSGLLARQRVQLYPLFFVLLSIPPATDRRAGSVSSTSSAQPVRDTVPV